MCDLSLIHHVLNWKVFLCWYFIIACKVINDISVLITSIFQTNRDVRNKDVTLLIVLFLVSHFNFLLVPCGGLSWLPVSFLLHVKYTLSYRIIVLANEILNFTHIIVFKLTLLSQKKSMIKCCEITDILLVTDTISTYQKTDI